MFIRSLLLFLSVFLLTACAYNSESANSNGTNMPKWVYAPSGDDYIGGVGVCGTHIKGVNGQRQLAISRAIDEIARQMGVKVSNILETQSSATSQSAAGSAMSSYSVHTVSGSVITAVIKDSWINPKTGELYIYMITK